MKDYHHAEKARGAWRVFWTVVFAIAAPFLLLSSDCMHNVLGVFLALFAVAGVYSIIRGYVWTMEVKNGVLICFDPTWPRHSGSVDLTQAIAIRVYSGSNSLHLFFADGTERKVKIFGDPRGLHDYVKENLPDILLEYDSGS